jgi:hypothetical protein
MESQRKRNDCKYTIMIFIYEQAVLINGTLSFNIKCQRNIRRTFAAVIQPRMLRQAFIVSSSVIS